MRKEIEKRPQIEGLVISPKTSEFLSRLGEIREINNGVVREKIILGVFDNAIRKAASRERLTGFSHVSIQLKSGNSWQIFSGESMSLVESLITPEKISDPTEGIRGSVLSILFKDTTEQNDAYCCPGGGDKMQSNVTTHVYPVEYDQSHSARIVLTFGQYYEMTEETAVTTPVPIRTDANGGSERNQMLQECLRISFGKINAAMEKIDSVESFLHASPKEWKRVFGNDQAV